MKMNDWAESHSPTLLKLPLQGVFAVVVAELFQVS